MAIKRTLFISLLLMMFSISKAQRILDYKVKNNLNVKERTMMLDIYRATLYESYRQEFEFVVNHFKVYGSYAWMEGTVQRKDGKELKFPDEAYDCCHVEALFKKVNGAWVLKANGAFSTDVWYACILSSYPEASRQIFSSNVLTFQTDCE